MPQETLTPENNTVTEEAQSIEWLKCSKSCRYFLKTYAWIQNRNTGQTVKWQLWPYLSDLIDLLLSERELVLFKARQIGWTWLLAGVADWHVLFKEAAKGLFMSQGEDEAWDTLGKAKFIISHLPQFLQPTQRHPDSRSILDFESHDSIIKAMPSTKDAGRATDATFIFRDELKAHPYGRDNFVSVGPAIDGGGQLVDLSTIDKSDANNHFTERVNRAMAGAHRQDLPSGLTVFRGGESGATLIFGGWKLRPVREENMGLTEWWDLRIKPKYTEFDREQEYPETIEEALRPAQARAFFDLQATEAMLGDILTPLQGIGELNIHQDMVKLYKLPQVGREYIVFTDPSDGVEDPFHTVVIDSKTWEGVAEAEGMTKADVCAQIHDELVKFYNKAYNTWEANAFAGGKFGETIKLLNTPNQAPRRNTETGQIIKDKPGWWTSSNLKKTMVYSLEEAIRKRLIICHNKTSIDQFAHFFVPEGGEPQMPRGMHDDALMAWGGAWQLRKYKPAGEMRVAHWQK